MEKNKVIIWRAIAISCALVWTIVLFANLFATGTLLENDVVSTVTFFSNILWGFCILVSLILICYPMQFYLYTLMCCISGLFVIVNNGNTNGLLMYALGCMFAYKQGFFTKHTPLKYLLLLLPLVAIVFQYRFGIDALVDSILDVLFLLVFCALVYFALAESLMKHKNVQHSVPANTIDLSGLTPDEILAVKEMIANKTFSTIGQDNENHFDNADKIDLCGLEPEEILLLQEVLTNKTLKAIAYDVKRGESAIKKQISNVYKKVGIHNKAHFLQLHKDEKLIFPE